MKIGIPKEIHGDECRVACTPQETQKIMALGYDVLVEKDAGLASGHVNEDYQAAGASIVDDTPELWKQADLICKVRPPEQHRALGVHEADWLSGGKTLISFFWPAQNAELLAQIAAHGASVLAMDAVPRISRAQKMDALSSMSHIAGYRAVIEAGQHFGRFFIGQITAAGKIPAAKVLVIGAGVAGLSAIGTAVNLGAMVRAFDTRLEVKEQIESMSAEFLELDFTEEGAGTGGYAKVMSAEFIAAEMALFAEQAREVDIIITTALIPGKPAPKLITKEMVDSMKPGSVIVDLAAEQGGNCEGTEAGRVVKQNGVSIIGFTDLLSRMAAQSSQLYAANIRHLLSDLTPEKDGVANINLDDEVIRATTVVHNGKITWPPPAAAPSVASGRASDDMGDKMSHKKPAAVTAPGIADTPSAGHRAAKTWLGVAIGALAIVGMGAVAPQSFMNHFIVFVLACFVGWQVVWNVTPALHTPLMSVTNAISGIIVIGALLQIGSSSPLGALLAMAAVVIASINIAGGFWVTQRMLNMFKK
ncbi:Re/Si-specific NAD(P)(+) transhydrogenase subunit alpha [Candidatus Spongiihabitans sp.]|uniref:Re/Si-specific NAD(P)(+) transhydrogenase subunit alpha n=1 Tax=Candidatus Spongiihabitans sp. TaxID=3101308 RepID=UPI003C7A0104